MRHLLLALSLFTSLAQAQQMGFSPESEPETNPALPWLLIGGGQAEHVESEVTTGFAKFGFGVPAYDGTPLAVEVAYWHFDERIGLAEDDALSLEFMPMLDAGPLRLFVRGGAAFMTEGTGWIYGGGLEFPMFRAGGYQWKLRADWERFTDNGDLVEDGSVDAATLNLIVAH
jgi:hypothetical protein